MNYLQYGLSYNFVQITIFPLYFIYSKVIGLIIGSNVTLLSEVKFSSKWPLIIVVESSICVDFLLRFAQFFVFFLNM